MIFLPPKMPQENSGRQQRKRAASDILLYCGMPDTAPLFNYFCNYVSIIHNRFFCFENHFHSYEMLHEATHETKNREISAFPAAYSPRVNTVLLESLLSLPLRDSESTLTYFIPSRNPTAVILLLWSGKCGQTADARTGCREPAHARLP